MAAASPDPSDDDPIAFARELLGSREEDSAILREAVLAARHLWELLYQVNQPSEPPQP